jgi:oligopeptide/dipeptide ABC transporter ATP-binding protein
MSIALEVRDLKVAVPRQHRSVLAVTDVSFAVNRGESLGIVGESGSGKSLTLRAIMDILPPRANVESVDLRFADGEAHRVAMVFQEPLAAMSPTKRIQDLIAEGVMATHGASRRAARERALELMAEVGIPHPAQRARMWPHELSGGLRQRVVIAMALSTDPTVLLCDEPTTALDVTVQDQILGLLDRLRRERGMAIVFVTHDLAVVATICQRIAVMYAGQVVEEGTAADVLGSPRHPYTEALIGASRSRAGEGGARPIGGNPPSPESFADGCRFAARCAAVREECLTAPYRLAETVPGQVTACIRTDELYGGRS